MSDYQKIIEQSIHSIVDIAYKQGYQDGQKAVENEKYSTHTHWYQKGYEEGKAELSEEEVHNLMSDLQKGDDLLTDDDLRLLINDAIKDKKVEQDKVTQWIKDNADFIKEMARMLEENE